MCWRGTPLYSPDEPDVFVRFVNSQLFGITARLQNFQFNRFNDENRFFLSQILCFSAVTARTMASHTPIEHFIENLADKAAFFRLNCHGRAARPEIGSMGNSESGDHLSIKANMSICITIAVPSFCSYCGIPVLPPYWRRSLVAGIGTGPVAGSGVLRATAKAWEELAIVLRRSPLSRFNGSVGNTALTKYSSTKTHYPEFRWLCFDVDTFFLLYAE